MFYCGKRRVQPLHSFYSQLLLAGNIDWEHRLGTLTGNVYSWKPGWEKKLLIFSFLHAISSAAYSIFGRSWYFLPPTT